MEEAHESTQYCLDDWQDGRSFGGAQITTFECRDATYEEFETVFRVLNGLYVRPCDVVRHGLVSMCRALESHVVIHDLSILPLNMLCRMQAGPRLLWHPT